MSDSAAISPSALSDLLKSASSRSLSLSDISGRSLKLNSHTYDFDTPLTFSSLNKTLTKSLISLFLQLQNPEINFKDYKQLCEEYDVKDTVKVTEKKYVFSYFQKGDDGVKKVRIDSGEAARNDRRKDGHEKKDSDHSKRRDNDRERGRSSLKDHHRSRSKRSRDDAGGSAKKKEKKDEAITHQQLLQDLNIVVDKRSGAPNSAKKRSHDGSATEADTENKMTEETETTENNMDATAHSGEDPPFLLSPEEEERRAIEACLSASGYEATKLSPEILERDRLLVEKVTNFEIPVGDSGSILRCGAMSSTLPQHNGRKPGASVDALSQRNFARVLALFEESKKEEQKLRRGVTNRTQQAKVKVQEKVAPTGKPIIIVPNAMTSPITLVNAGAFFGTAKFIPREKCQKTKLKEPSVTITRTVSNRFGGGKVEYEIIDNPKRMLKSPADWARVVAVVAQGESWQFKGWKMGW
eukprot:CAMPEP_0203675330 /NCGR_PEP_ID=MMETSP0090-20130426/19789_1 /ASSEMBLY_ACC=CAM_ASM_001088 /TAXON_ID=426623 /ORGANISM="Chaetoceros affinis, Strain CCMP159" /LENGTH=467 /DNA_ID=CAMNT_0050541487 /DNA_START=61 /DNA_END=1461 /DNA_ORIENTATION=-